MLVMALVSISVIPRPPSPLLARISDSIPPAPPRRPHIPYSNRKIGHGANYLYSSHAYQCYKGVKGAPLMNEGALHALPLR